MTPPGRRRSIVTVVVLVLSIVGSMIHQAGPSFAWRNGYPHFAEWRLWNWYIEDAAISFGYARNWVEGAGLVAFRGGERIEGFSNPTWVMLLAAWEWLGVDGFHSAKYMGVGFGVATILLIWRIAHEVIDDADSYAPLIAPVLLACFPHFAFWNAAGLENPLINFLLAGAMWRAIVESKRGGYPWSSLWFMFLALSRPETVMYAAWGGFASMVMAFRNGNGIKQTAQWLFTFFLPFSVYHAIRYEYFAWIFPNTYYAKLGDKEFKPFGWDAGGWRYVRNWSWDTGSGWFTPVVLSGLIGLRGMRRWLVPVLTVILVICASYPAGGVVAAIEWWPTDLPVPEWWREARVWGFVAVALTAMLAAFPDRRSFGRVLAWGCVLITFFFCVRASGDWMKGFRWMAFISVPGVLLLTCGIEEMAALLQRILGRTGLPGWSRPGWITAVVLTLGVMPGWFIHSAWFIGKRETGPYAVQKRVVYTEFLMNRTWQVDKIIHNLDVDMGAHVYWSKHQMTDMAGLVDVSKAHHAYRDRSFIQEYIFSEVRPSVAHVHGGWANSSKIPTYPEWKRDYVPMPPFPMSARSAHVGNFMRRDVFMSSTYDGGRSRQVPFARGIVLSGFDIPSPEAGIGKAFYIEISAQYRQLDDKENFRFFMFLADHEGHLQVFDVPVGYDWLPPVEWRVGEVWTGRFSFSLDSSLPEGSYDLGFVAIGGDGTVVPLADGPELKRRAPTRAPLPEGVLVGGDPNVPVRFAKGEVIFPAVLTIGPPATGEVAARTAADQANVLAGEGSCVEAAAAWRIARFATPNATKSIDDKRAVFAPLQAACYAQMALRVSSTDLPAAVPLLEEARAWTWKSDALVDAQRKVGQLLYDRGMAARAERSWEEAYRAFDGAVRANPSLSWARRYAEEARDHRLGISDDPDDPGVPAAPTRAKRARPVPEPEPTEAAPEGAEE